MKNIKRGDYVTLNIETKDCYRIYTFPAGTKCRVWKSRKNGILHLSAKSDFFSVDTLRVSNKNVTLVETPKSNVKVGDIFVSSGGYDQTNNTFYRVVTVKNHSLEIVEIGSDRKYTGPMCGEETPRINDTGSDKKLVRFLTDINGNISFKGIWGRASSWNGEPKFFSEWR
jgi:hypothetical protein